MVWHSVWASDSTNREINGGFTLEPNSVRKKADAVLALMSYSVILDLASSSLNMQSSKSDGEKLVMSQLGGGATLSDSVPLYLEGAIAYSRYDPMFVASNGEQSRSIPMKWTTLSAMGGVGWDFPLRENLVLRPIVNFSLGTVQSDLKIANWFLNQKFDTEFNFSNGGSMNALGYGGAFMLDYELVQPEHEIDIELRYSAMHLEGFANGGSIDSHANSQTANLYTRYRAPTGINLFARPLRYVLEASHSRYYGDQAGQLGFDYLSTIGTGLEVDSSDLIPLVTRTRFVVRYMFGPGVEGAGLSIACSF
ncbi:hypothetical protein [Chitinibacter fontanus]|uniref:hypothetical protein n=1 Tax=Chitinibacter fontanus TaxID=1737446 RepID=UPI001D1381ED|nr:hypothetical protein [Chitinibacter fontanus]